MYVSYRYVGGLTELFRRKDSHKVASEKENCMNLRNMILEATLPEDDRIVGGVHCDESGFWLDIGSEAKGFLGSTYEAACITAANVDWWTPGDKFDSFNVSNLSQITEYFKGRSENPDWKNSEDLDDLKKRRNRYGWNMGLFSISSGNGASVFNQEFQLPDHLLELVRIAAEESKDFPVKILPGRASETESIVLSSWDSGETWYFEEGVGQFFPAIVEIGGQSCTIRRVCGPCGIEFANPPIHRLEAQMVDSVIVTIHLLVREEPTDNYPWRSKAEFSRKKENENFSVDRMSLGVF